MIDVTDGTNLGFRISIATPASGAWCGPSGFAYLNSTDSNYGTYVAAVLSAKATGSSITIYQTTDSSGFCHIGYLSVN